jgi:uncharacterized protein YqgC (DUF456 family)
MARSHHRKKHKEQLQQFKHKSDTALEKAKSKGSRVFAVTGAVLGLAIGYIASSGSYAWIAAGLVLGLLAGYFVGERIDKG